MNEWIDDLVLEESHARSDEPAWSAAAHKIAEDLLDDVGRDLTAAVDAINRKQPDGAPTVECATGDVITLSFRDVRAEIRKERSGKPAVEMAVWKQRRGAPAVQIATLEIIAAGSKDVRQFHSVFGETDTPA